MKRYLAPGARLLSSIGFRLIAVVVATGVLAFAIIGGLTIFRLDVGLQEQADALGVLSGKQVAQRLDGESQLALARIERLGIDTAQRLRNISQRSDVRNAVVLGNDVTIRELLVTVANSSDLEILLALDKTGRVVGANVAADLLALNQEVQKSKIASAAATVMQSNRRSRPQSREEFMELNPGLIRALGLHSRLTFAHKSIEPIFDDFGDVIGTLTALRVLRQNESTLQDFSTLTAVGVVVMNQNQIVSAAGQAGVTFSEGKVDNYQLAQSDDGGHVARCADFSMGLKVCTFTDASVVTETRDQMFRIGAEQTRSLLRQFLLFAAITLAALVFALWWVVRHVTRGLPTLAAAAKQVADGNLEAPFRATGVGEVYDLSLAFERMLATLRSSIGTIQKLAFYDTVTELPNREMFRREGPKLIQGSKCGAFLFLDLDGFKTINDTFGHKSGDALLHQVAERLNKFIIEDIGVVSQGSAIVARVGGDEFAAILPNVATEADAEQIAKSLIDLLGRPFDVGGLRMGIGASVGITRFPADGQTYEELLINADLAMYTAKKRGETHLPFSMRK